jgi:hypothetical protein
VKFNKHPLALKNDLRCKVGLKELDKILQVIIEQTEGQFRDWQSVV